MKKLNLQLGSIKEMLTKEQMKKMAGGGGYPTCAEAGCPFFDECTICFVSGDGGRGDYGCCNGLEACQLECNEIHPHCEVCSGP